MEIRRAFGPALASLFAVAVVVALPGTAAGLGQKGPQSYYLALGDSIAYGYQPGKGGGPGAFDTGYVDPFAAHLRKLSPKIQVVNYGCPGESSVTFTKGGCPALREGPKLHDPFRGAQLKAALSFLKAHRGRGQPDHPDAVGQRPGSVVGQGQGRTQGDRVVRFAPRLDPRATSISRTDC